MHGCTKLSLQLQHLQGHKLVDPRLFELFDHGVFLLSHFPFCVAGFVPRRQRTILISHRFRIVNMHLLRVLVDHLDVLAGISVFFHFIKNFLFLSGFFGLQLGDGKNAVNKVISTTNQTNKGKPFFRPTYLFQLFWCPVLNYFFHFLDQIVAMFIQQAQCFF